MVNYSTLDSQVSQAGAVPIAEEDSHPTSKRSPAPFKDDGRFTDEMLATVTRLLTGKKPKIGAATPSRKDSAVDFNTNLRSRSSVGTYSNALDTSPAKELDLAGLT